MPTIVRNQIKHLKRSIVLRMMFQKSKLPKLFFTVLSFRKKQVKNAVNVDTAIWLTEIMSEIIPSEVPAVPWASL